MTRPAPDTDQACADLQEKLPGWRVTRSSGGAFRAERGHPAGQTFVEAACPATVVAFIEDYCDDGWPEPRQPALTQVRGAGQSLHAG